MCACSAREKVFVECLWTAMKKNITSNRAEDEAFITFREVDGSDARAQPPGFDQDALEVIG